MSFVKEFIWEKVRDLGNYACSAIVLRDTVLAWAIVKTASWLLEEGLPVHEWLIDVIGAPLAIICVTSDRTNQAPYALVHVKLEEERCSENIEEPYTSLAVVSVVHDIVTDVVISCDLGEPDVEEDGHPDNIEC